MSDKIRDEQTDNLFRAVLSLNNIDECYAFFEDLCTVSELREMAKRLTAARMLNNNYIYSDISEKTGLSTATISRRQPLSEVRQRRLRRDSPPPRPQKVNPQYTSLAAYYDRLNSHIDYFGYAAFIASRFREYGVPDGSLVLDLACGTGNITLPLSEMGYDMIAVDSSCEMLDVGRRKPAVTEFCGSVRICGALSFTARSRRSFPALTA